MRKASNYLVGLMAAGVCFLMTWLTITADLTAVIYNLAVLGVMLIIIICAIALGFHRMHKTRKGLDNASRKLMAVYRDNDRAELVAITKPGAEIFGVAYLDRKYQEYLGYLRKTNSPCDIGDYIGEYEINNFTHRRLVEMVPDILTSLGILGTFMGLVWGLRGFNPVSYEAMASSITSLIDGIKVAFVTSIYGIALSLAYSYWLRGELTAVSESLDNFLDKYYLVAVSPTDATAMNHVLANQKEQNKLLGGLSKEMSDSIAVSMTDHMDPVLGEMKDTLQQFSDTVTMNQQEMLENVAASVMAAMKKEFISEFLEMRTLLAQTNEAQKGYLEYTSKMQKDLQHSLTESSRELKEAVMEVSQTSTYSNTEINKQQEHMTQFVEFMTQAMNAMSAMNQASLEAQQAVAGQLQTMEELAARSVKNASAAQLSAEEANAAAGRAKSPVVKNEITDIDLLTDRLDQMIMLLEQVEKKQEQQQTKRRGLFF